MSRRELLAPIGPLLDRARASAPAEKHQLAFYAIEATLKLCTIADLAAALAVRPPDAPLAAELRGLGRASAGSWLALYRRITPDVRCDLGASWRQLAEAAVAAQVVHEDLRSLASRSIQGAFSFAVAYRNAVLGHGAWRHSSYYDTLAPLLLEAAERLATEPTLLGEAALWVRDSDGAWLPLGGPQATPPSTDAPPAHPVLVRNEEALDLFPLVGTRRHPTQGTAQLGVLNQVRTRSRPDGGLKVVRSRFLDYATGEIFDLRAPQAIAELLEAGRMGGRADVSPEPLKLVRSSPEPAHLEALTTGHRFQLRGRTRIGRREACDLTVAARHVSGEHALVFWSGGWRVRDLGSRNGCWVDGHSVSVGIAVPLVEGSVVAFGSPLEQWRLTSAGPPVATAVCASETRTATDGLLVLPDDRDPEWTVYRDSAGHWVAESSQERRPVHDRELLTTGQAAWQLFLPEESSATTYASDPILVTLQDCTCLFEHVDTDPLWTVSNSDGHDISFAHRPFVRTVLVLARARAADPSAGWSSAEALASQVGLPQVQVLQHLRQARRALNVAGFVDGSSIVERDAEGGIRLGMERIQITAT